MTYPCKGQTIKNDFDFGAFLIGVEPTKVSEFGAFGPYLGPEIRKTLNSFLGHNKNSGNSSGVSTPHNHIGILRTLLPSGKLPTDGKFSYNGDLGYKLLIGFEPLALRRSDGNGVVLNVFYVKDRNALKFFAPSGLGIFTDPTTLLGSVKTRLIGFETKAPIWSAPSLDGLHSIFGSIGYTSVMTETTAKASSAFLDIQLREKKLFWSPIYSTEYHFDNLNGSVKTLSTQIKISTYRSQNMYSGIFSVSLILNY